jgi:hypothetical protein
MTQFGKGWFTVLAVAGLVACATPCAEAARSGGGGGPKFGSGGGLKAGSFGGKLPGGFGGAGRSGGGFLGSRSPTGGLAPGGKSSGGGGWAGSNFLGFRPSTGQSAAPARAAKQSPGGKGNSGKIKYATDSNGILLKTEGPWSGRPVGPRDRAAQREVAKSTGQPDMHGAHGYPHAGGGATGKPNIVAAHKTTNQGLLKVVENEAGRSHKQGNHVYYEFERQPDKAGTGSKAFLQKVTSTDPKTGRTEVTSANTGAARPTVPWGKALEARSGQPARKARPALQGLRPGERGN